MRRFSAASVVLACAALLQGCMVMARTVETPDPQCQLMARHMQLEAVQIGAIGGCANQGCVAILVAASAFTAATAIVSGTIAVVGNTVYWLERQARCTPPVALPEIDALAPDAPGPRPVPRIPPVPEPAR